MTIKDFLDTENWIFNFCNNIQVNDQRIKSRLCESMQKIIDNPSKSHPKQFDKWNALLPLHR